MANEGTLSVFRKSAYENAIYLRGQIHLYRHKVILGVIRSSKCHFLIGRMIFFLSYACFWTRNALFFMVPTCGSVVNLKEVFVHRVCFGLKYN